MDFARFNRFHGFCFVVSLFAVRFIQYVTELDPVFGIFIELFVGRDKNLAERE